MTHEKPNSIGVEDIRSQVNNDIVIKPYSSPYKIYIINEGEKMTVQAQNALLNNECGGAASHDCEPVRCAEYEAGT